MGSEGMCPSLLCLTCSSHLACPRCPSGVLANKQNAPRLPHRPRFLDYGFTNNLYTDLTLRCQGRDFHVHRVVICLQSGYFASACRQAPARGVILSFSLLFKKIVPMTNRVPLSVTRSLISGKKTISIMSQVCRQMDLPSKWATADISTQQ